jgi:hypothetical protein
MNTWGKTWNIIIQNITDKINNIIKIKYNNNKEIHEVRNKNFYKGTENLTNVTFIDNRTQLLSKGLKYNLHYKQNNWIKTLAIEADTGINNLI